MIFSNQRWFIILHKFYIRNKTECWNLFQSVIDFVNFVDHNIHINVHNCAMNDKMSQRINCNIIMNNTKKVEILKFTKSCNKQKKIIFAR